MDFTEVVKSRRDIRKYRNQPVPEEKLEKLYEALRLAPSGNNHQPYKFVFIRDSKLKKQLVEEACHQESFKDAAVIMVACCEKGREFDTAIAVDHMTLAATNEGLATCWVGWCERDKIKKMLNIPANMEVPIIVPIGYADESPAARPRKSLSELICVDTYK